MLAGIRNYLHLWQLPLFVSFAVLSLWAGGSLLLRSLRKRQYPKRIRMSRCVLISMLAGASGGLAGAVFFFLFESIRAGTGVSLRLPGALVAGIVMILIAYLVAYAMLELPMGAALKVLALPLTVMLLLTGAVGAGAGIPAYFLRKDEVKQQRCLARKLPQIAVALAYHQDTFGDPPQQLKDLAEKNMIDANFLICPGTPEKPIGFFYHPLRMTRQESAARIFVLCDFRHTHRGGRNAILANGRYNWYPEEHFESLLTLEDNKQFAAALRAAESP